jgi:hypothetical protein
MIHRGKPRTRSTSLLKFRGKNRQWGVAFIVAEVTPGPVKWADHAEERYSCAQWVDESPEESRQQRLLAWVLMTRRGVLQTHRGKREVASDAREGLKTPRKLMIRCVQKCPLRCWAFSAQYAPLAGAESCA